MMRFFNRFFHRLITVIAFVLAFLIVIYLIHIYYQKQSNVFSIINNNGRPIFANRIEIYAHRGGRGLVPENTLMAYKTALEQGVDYVDMDINMTKDGVLVVYHNTSLNPDITRDKSGKFITKATPIHELTYQELQNYNVGKINPQTSYASLFPTQHALKNAKIPTLAQVIDFVTKNANDTVGFQIEIKADTDEIQKNPAFYKQYIANLYKILKEKNIINRTEVQSFEWPLLLELQSYDANIKTVYLTDINTKALIQKYGAKLNAHSIPEIIKAYHGYCWGPQETEISQKDVDEAHRHGIKIVPWGYPTVEKTDFNTPVVMSLIQWNVDGIITDRPDILRGVLAGCGYPLPTPITNQDNKWTLTRISGNSLPDSAHE